MFVDMKIQWAATLLGCLAAVMVPVPIFFYYYGPKLRQKSKWAPTMPAAPPPNEENEDNQDLEKETKD